MQILLRWAVGAAALYLTVLLGQALQLDIGLKRNVVNVFLVVLALALVNAFIRPIVKLVTLPLNCLTLGLLGFVINALMFWLVSALDIGLHVGGFLPALFGSVVMSLISGLLGTLIPEKNER